MEVVITIIRTRSFVDATVRDSYHRRTVNLILCRDSTGRHLCTGMPSNSRGFTVWHATTPTQDSTKPSKRRLVSYFNNANKIIIIYIYLTGIGSDILIIERKE